MAKTKNTTQQIRAADYTGELKVPVYPRMTDNQGRIKAEHVLKLMDIAGGLPGFKLLAPGALIVTGTFDRTNFKNQIWAWEIIEIQSRLTQLWSHSFEVQVCVRANDFRKAKTREVATAYLVYVVLDENRQARDIPYALDLTDPNTQQLAMAADLRKANRKKETREIPFIPITEEDQPVIV
ncbi:MAG: hypothetical protein KTR14_03555, partial [Vampirovibrio sp.]|nr:hypothetical protein [Vampirovibrio sp.]